MGDEGETDGAAVEDCPDSQEFAGVVAAKLVEPCTKHANTAVIARDDRSFIKRMD